jgi:TRAP-type C4-dicarboxylate transport system permease small subunit
MFSKIIDVLTKIAGFIAGLCILVTAFLIVYEIIVRGIFNSPTEWVLEISVYLILTAGFLGLAVAYRRNAHVRVDLITGRLDGRARCVLDTVTTLLGIVFFFVFMTESMDVVLTSIEFNRLSPSILRTPLWIPQMSLVIGGFLILMQMVRGVLADIYRLKSGINLDEGQGN